MKRDFSDSRSLLRIYEEVYREFSSQCFPVASFLQSYIKGFFLHVEHFVRFLEKFRKQPRPTYSGIEHVSFAVA